MATTMSGRGGRGSYIAGVAAGVFLAGVGTAQAQLISQGSARIIEWDVQQAGDVSPGAMVVDTRGEDSNRVWFVTRFAPTYGLRNIPRLRRVSRQAISTAMPVAYSVKHRCLHEQV